MRSSTNFFSLLPAAPGYGEGERCKTAVVVTI